MITVSLLTLLFVSLFTLTQTLTLAPRQTPIPWTDQNIEAIMALIGIDANGDPNGYPTSCDFNCSAFSEAVAGDVNALGATLGSNKASDFNVTALCTPTILIDSKTCESCVVSTAPSSNIAIYFPGPISQFSAACGISTSSSPHVGSEPSSSSAHAGSEPTTTPTPGAFTSLYQSLGWVPAIGVTLVAGLASLF